MKIAHVALWTRNLAAQQHFWHQFFGATSNPLYVSKNRPGFRSHFISLSEGPTLELMTLEALAPGPHGEELTGWAHIAINVGGREEVDLMVKHASEQGILVSAARQTGDGFYEAIIRDPDGNLIEIVSDQ
ncbi:VOC family protein [Pantoea sp. GM01]|uniref:VOC family protein n=1 Tax=Pantoea sp. GM01 TaxID=1144320 RepID=UPI000271078B|nr:VOC family protein [Pantoea sp. GM01]EJL90293.1 lactoylglutathione lyase-like lyase [Pantoea sp. GM01]